jgi:hypothetical protein
LNVPLVNPPPQEAGTGTAYFRGLASRDGGEIVSPP